MAFSVYTLARLPGQLIIIEKENGAKIGVWLKKTKLHACYGGVLNA